MEPKTESWDKQKISQQITQEIQNYSQTTIDPSRTQNRSQEQIDYNRATSGKPLWQDSSSYDSDELSSRNTSIENGNGKNDMSDSPTIDLLNPASCMATSKAAEQWRKSWRDYVKKRNASYRRTRWSHVLILASLQHADKPAIQTMSGALKPTNDFETDQ